MNQRSPEREFRFQDLGSCAQLVAVGLKSGSALVLITSDPSVAFSYFPLSLFLVRSRHRGAGLLIPVPYVLLQHAARVTDD